MSYKTKQEIYDRLLEHQTELVKRGFDNIVGIFLKGSQNYKLDYEDSDIDTVAIVLPSVQDFINNCAPVSTTIILDNNEHIDIKDIRSIIEQFKKSSPQYLEILFTDYKLINYYYESYLSLLFNNREQIARANINSLLNAISGMSMNKMKALEHPYPSIKDKIDKYGYDPKQLHHILRLNDFIKKIVAGEPFESCLVPSYKEWLLSVKTTPMPLEIARALAETVDSETNQIRQNNIIEQYKPNEHIMNLLQEVKSNILLYHLSSELCANNKDEKWR